MSWTLQWTGNLSVSIGGLPTSVALSLISGTASSVEIVDSITVTTTISGFTYDGRYGQILLSVGNDYSYTMEAAGTEAITFLASDEYFDPAKVAALSTVKVSAGSHGPTGAITFTSITVAVVTHAASSPPPAPTPDGPPPIDTVFTHDTSLNVQFDTDYTVNVEVRTAPGGNRVTSANGTVLIRIHTLSIADITSSATQFTINGGPSTSNLVTITEGKASFVIRFPTGGIAAGSNVFLHAKTQGHTGVSYTLGAGYKVDTESFTSPAMKLAAGPNLAFTVQPPTVIDVGAQFVTPVEVSVLTGTGTVNTSWTGDIILTMKNLAGVDSTEFLIGTKTITPVSGVATFPNLYISKIGFYTLHATSTIGTQILTGVSTGIQIVGDDGEQSLRQNLRDDATVWVKTTGVSAPTYSTFTDANKSTLDGDEAVTANIVFDGTRWVFPYTIKAALVRFKVKLSTLASTPTIELYSSQDTTDGEDGTWTEVTSMTPTTTGVFIAEFSFSSPVYAKGLWLTLNDGGGAATGTWYSQQVMGKYLGSAITFLADDNSIEVPDEHYLSVPAPLETLGGLRTVTRNIQIRNNTSTEQNLVLESSPARSTGDDLVDSDNFSAIDSNGNLLSDGFTVPALATVPAILRYTIPAADNDKSGNHYIRLSLSTSQPQTNLSYFGERDSGISVVCNWRLIADGSFIASVGSGNDDHGQLYYLPSSNRLFVHTFVPADNNTVFTKRLVSPATLTTPSGAAFFITGWTPGETATLSGTGILDDRALLSNTASTLVVKPNVSAWTNGSNITRSSCLTFNIPAQTTGYKHFNYAPDNLIGIQNGNAVNSVVYLMNVNGSVAATIDPTTPFGGRGLRSFVWDSVNAEFYLVSSVSAGSRVVARYTKAGVLVASVSVTTEAALEADGIMIASPYVYVMYGGEHLYRHDIQTMANATLMHTLAAGNILSPGFIQIAF